jgi:hypothetical protein
MGEDDRVIVCCHEPDWIIDTHNDNVGGGGDEYTYTAENLNYLCNVVLKGKCALRLAGDLHCYMRHAFDPNATAGVNSFTSNNININQASNSMQSNGTTNGHSNSTSSNISNQHHHNNNHAVKQNKLSSMTNVFTSLFRSTFGSVSSLLPSFIYSEDNYSDCAQGPTMLNNISASPVLSSANSVGNSTQLNDIPSFSLEGGSPIETSTSPDNVALSGSPFTVHLEYANGNQSQISPDSSSLDASLSPNHMHDNNINTANGNLSTSTSNTSEVYLEDLLPSLNSNLSLVRTQSMPSFQSPEKSKEKRKKKNKKKEKKLSTQLELDSGDDDHAPMEMALGHGISRNRTPQGNAVGVDRALSPYHLSSSASASSSGVSSSQVSALNSRHSSHNTLNDLSTPPQQSQSVFLSNSDKRKSQTTRSVAKKSHSQHSSRIQSPALPNNAHTFSRKPMKKWTVDDVCTWLTSKGWSNEQDSTNNSSTSESTSQQTSRPNHADTSDAANSSASHPSVVQSFRAAKIDGAVLCLLDDVDLIEELNITSRIQRKKLLAHITAEKEKQSSKSHATVEDETIDSDVEEKQRSHPRFRQGRHHHDSDSHDPDDVSDGDSQDSEDESEDDDEHHHNAELDAELASFNNSSQSASSQSHKGQNTISQRLVHPSLTPDKFVAEDEEENDSEENLLLSRVLSDHRSKPQVRQSKQTTTHHASIAPTKLATPQPQSINLAASQFLRSHSDGDGEPGEQQSYLSPAASSTSVHRAKTPTPSSSATTIAATIAHSPVRNERQSPIEFPTSTHSLHSTNMTHLQSQGTHPASTLTSSTSTSTTSKQVDVRPPPALIVSGGGGAFMHPTHVPDPAPINFRGDTYVRASSYPPVDVSRAYTLLNIFGFRKRNWRFDLVGGMIYFLLIFDTLPVCDVSAVINSQDWIDVIYNYVYLVFNTHLKMFNVGYTSVVTFIIWFIFCYGFGEIRWGKLNRLIATILHCLSHSLTAFAVLIFMEVFLQMGFEKKILGQEEPLFTTFLNKFPLAQEKMNEADSYTYGFASILTRVLTSLFDLPDNIARYRALACTSNCITSQVSLDGMWSSSAVAAAALHNTNMTSFTSCFNNSTFTIHDLPLSRFSLWSYYSSWCLYYWVLVTPLVSFIFGSYLYICSCFLNALYTEAFSSLRIEGFKNFLRLHINSKGDLEIYTLGMDRVPKSWIKDKKWSGARKPFQSDSYTWERPSVFKPESNQNYFDSVKLVDYLVIHKNPRSTKVFQRDTQKNHAHGHAHTQVPHTITSHISHSSFTDHPTTNSKMNFSSNTDIKKKKRMSAQDGVKIPSSQHASHSTRPQQPYASAVLHQGKFTILNK